ncbi:exodeoxyribonuclease VII small subunit [uncultured Bacteroides sp.]|jgi:exodeoxyribonuclease VII small subunit|uniref:exodeoxyribonuclease VII small subunit n=1 Tax=uncultured Bacteroides sp. TaxID=162156 RepID=UPI002AA6CA40|nr:exodeoxyribonuclease VII small subunit [uncultured Bacteroides sp.]
MAEKKESYAQAMEKLENIVSAVEKDELDIDQLSKKLKEAQKLVSFCKDKLYKADEEIKKIMEGEEN